MQCIWSVNIAAISHQVLTHHACMNQSVNSWSVNLDVNAQMSCWLTSIKRKESAHRLSKTKIWSCKRISTHYTDISCSTDVNMTWSKFVQRRSQQVVVVRVTGSRNGTGNDQQYSTKYLFIGPHVGAPLLMSISARYLFTDSSQQNKHFHVVRFSPWLLCHWYNL